MIIVIGVVVDDGIIVSENIVRKAELGQSPIEAATNGISEVFLPVLTTILTTLIAFSPMFFMPGVVGKFIYVIPLVITLALFISLLEVCIALPAHLVPGLKHLSSKKRKANTFFDKIRHKFNVTIDFLLKHKYKLTVSYLILMFSTFFLAFKFMDFVLFPGNTADYIFIQVETDKDSSINKTEKVVSRVEKYIKTIGKEDLDAFISRVGFKGTDEREFKYEKNFAQIVLFLTPFTTRDNSADDIADMLREQTKNIEDLVDIKFNVFSGGPPVGRPIEMQITSSNDADRKRVTQEIFDFLSNLDGTQDLNRNDTLNSDQIELVFNYERISRLGLNVADISTTVRTAFRGLTVTNIRVDNEDIDYKLMFSKSDRAKMSSLENLRISNATGQLIPISSLVSFKTVPGYPNYYHYEGKRSTTITGDINKKVSTPLKVYATVKEKFKDLEFSSTKVTFGGETEETNSSFRNLFKSFIIAVIGIYFLLILLFNSFTQPLFVLFSIPFGLLGVVLAFAIHGEPLGFFALLGTLGLVGILVNDSLVLVYHINNLKKENPDKTLHEVVVIGTTNRLRAIMLTSITTVVGVLPLAYGIGGSDPFISPMGLALGYGLLFSTPLTLLFIPASYLITEEIKTGIGKLKGRFIKSN